MASMMEQREMMMAAPPKVGVMTACCSFACGRVNVLHACYPFCHVSLEVFFSMQHLVELPCGSVCVFDPQDTSVYDRLDKSLL